LGDLRRIGIEGVAQLPGGDCGGPPGPDRDGAAGNGGHVGVGRGKGDGFAGSPARGDQVEGRITIGLGRKGVEGDGLGDFLHRQGLRPAEGDDRRG